MPLTLESSRAGVARAMQPTLAKVAFREGSVLSRVLNSREEISHRRSAAGTRGEDARFLWQEEG
jgi:hypothetical protein